MKRIFTLGLALFFLFAAVSFTAADDAGLAPVPVGNGEILVRTKYECVCPLSVSAGGDSGYYVFLQYVGAPFSSSENRKAANGTSGGDDIGFYVAPGSTAVLKVPIGDYRLYYCRGNNWYGLDKRFGSSTQYSTSDEILSFYASSQSRSLELRSQYDGSLTTEKISAAAFPG